MNEYKITFAVGKIYRQFSGVVKAETETEAKQKAMEIFITENPLYSAHCRICMCHKIPTYNTIGR